MTEEVIAELKKDQPSEFHSALLTHCKRLAKISRGKMSAMYPEWDYQDSVFRGEVPLDRDDRSNERKGRPVKMIVPNTFAQCMTFTSFLFLMFNQNQTFFELGSAGDEDSGKVQQDCENVLERDLRKNQFNTLLFQHLLDISRFGMGVMEVSWTKIETRVFVAPDPTPFTDPITQQQTFIQGPAAWQTFTKYEGNLLRSVSPYRFLPDTRHPLVDFQKGEFCACEETYSMGALRDLEAEGEVAGVDFIQPLPINFSDERGGQTRADFGGDSVAWIKGQQFDANNSSHNALVTKMQVKLVPSKFKIDGKPMGEEDFQVLYHVWYANDNRIIRAEPAGWWHNEFGWVVAQFTPDMHHTINLGLADLIYRLQDLISWYLNSHVSSVRRIIQNRLIIDPRIIDTDTLDGEKDIYLRKGVTVPNLEKAVGQLRVQDVTSAHTNDMDILGKIMEQVTGVNGNAMGQYNSGRRSAQEARVVTAGAAGRMKLHGHLIWESSLGRLGRLMLSNSRQSLSPESFRWVIGGGATDPVTGQNDLADRYVKFKGTPEEIICSDDYMVFDSTLSSEKGFMAQAIQELLSVILQANPMAAMQLTQKIDPAKMVDEMFYLRGSGNVSRFNYTPGTAPMMPPQVMPTPGAAPVAQPTPQA